MSLIVQSKIQKCEQQKADDKNCNKRQAEENKVEQKQRANQETMMGNPQEHIRMGEQSTGAQMHRKRGLNRN